MYQSVQWVHTTFVVLPGRTGEAVSVHVANRQKLPHSPIELLADYPELLGIGIPRASIWLRIWLTILLGWQPFWCSFMGWQPFWCSFIGPPVESIVVQKANGGSGRVDKPRETGRRCTPGGATVP